MGLTSFLFVNDLDVPAPTIRLEALWTDFWDFETGSSRKIFTILAMKFEGIQGLGLKQIPRYDIKCEK